MSNAFNTGEFRIAPPAPKIPHFTEEELNSLSEVVNMAIIEAGRLGDLVGIQSLFPIQLKIAELLARGARS